MRIHHLRLGSCCLAGAVVSEHICAPQWGQQVPMKGNADGNGKRWASPGLLCCGASSLTGPSAVGETPAQRRDSGARAGTDPQRRTRGSGEGEAWLEAGRAVGQAALTA